MIRQKLRTAVTLFAIMLSCMTFESAAWDWSRLAQAGMKGIQAMTLTDDDMIDYVRQSVTQMDKKNKVAGPKSRYTIRLKKITAGLTDVDGIPLNFKVYLTSQINAFACPDGSVRVFSGLMDVMNDDELLGVIGHEIGHVAKHHSKKALKAQLINDAARDVLGAKGGMVGALSDSQLGAIGATLLNTKYSRKQETEADDYGYYFLKSHGKNPLGMATAFQKLSSSGSEPSALQKMFSDHPDTQARIKRVVDRARSDGYQIPAGLQSY